MSEKGTKSIDVETARSHREFIYASLDFFLSNKKAFDEFGSSLNWIDIRSLPEWVFWSPKDIDRLINICGTIFLLPMIRMWIDAKKIQSIRDLLGEGVLENILEQIAVNKTNTVRFNSDEIIQSISSTGAAVMIYSHGTRIRPWISEILPRPKAKLDSELALQILAHGYKILSLSEDNA